jgi:hypothetical protein
MTGQGNNGLRGTQVSEIAIDRDADVRWRPFPNLAPLAPRLKIIELSSTSFGSESVLESVGTKVLKWRNALFNKSIRAAYEVNYSVAVDWQRAERGYADVSPLVRKTLTPSR